MALTTSSWLYGIFLSKHSFLYNEKKLSIGELSRQLPLLEWEPITLYFSKIFKYWRQEKCTPWSECKINPFELTVFSIKASSKHLITKFIYKHVTHLAHE